MSALAVAKQGEMSPAERKLRNARAVVVQAYPFFGALLLNQKVVEVVGDPRVPTMATDGEHLYFNPEFVLRMPNEELHGVCAHEALHPGFCHHLRRGERDKEEWNVACDYVINPILLDAGFKLPEKALYRADLRGMTSEQVYAKLASEKPPQPPQAEDESEDDEEGESQGGGEGEGDDESEGRSDGAGDAQGEGQGQGEPSKGEGGADSNGGAQDGGDVGGCGWLRDGAAAQSQAERQEEESKWKQRMASAAMHAAGSMPGSLAEAVQELLNPRADWRDLLRRYMNALTSSDQSWRRQNRRFIASGTYLPSMLDETIGRVCFVCDVSGSMPEGAPQRTLSEVASICTEIKPEGLDVVFFDSRVTASDSYEVGDEPNVGMLVPGGGGTIFNAAYDWIAAQGHEYSVVIFLTDLYPNDDWSVHRVPECPVLWIDYTDGTIVPPYGDEVIRLPREVTR